MKNGRFSRMWIRHCAEKLSAFLFICEGIHQLVVGSPFTHWGRTTHICVNTLTSIGSDNGLSPGRRQALIWTNAGLLSTGPLEKNFSEILIEMQNFSFIRKCLRNGVHFVPGVLKPCNSETRSVHPLLQHRQSIEKTRDTIIIKQIGLYCVSNQVINIRDTYHHWWRSKEFNIVTIWRYRNLSKQCMGAQLWNESYTSVGFQQHHIALWIPTQRASNAENVSIWWCLDENHFTHILMTVLIPKVKH